MHALLIIAHGSRKQDSNQEVRDLTRKVADRAPHFDLAECAFLELADPDIVEGGSKLVKAGATSLTILPYFLVEGRHVATDVPDEVAKINALFPDLEVNILPYFGAADGIIDELVDQISG